MQIIVPPPQADTPSASGIDQLQADDYRALIRRLAHDINNVLGPVMGYAGLLKEGLPPGSRQREHASTIEAEAARAFDLVEHMRSLVRASSVPLHEIDLLTALPSAASAGKAGIEPLPDVTIASPPAGVRIRGDEAQLAKMFKELFENARDAARGGHARVVVTTTVRDGPAASSAPSPTPADRIEDAGEGWLTRRFGSVPFPCLAIKVADTGSGMDRQTLAQLHRTLFSTKLKARDAGMGFAVLRAILAHWGGAYEVSAKPGAGTAVTLLLPIIA